MRASLAYAPLGYTKGETDAFCWFVFLCVRPTATANNFSAFFVGLTLKTSIKKWKFNKLVFSSSLSLLVGSNEEFAFANGHTVGHNTTSNSTFLSHLFFHLFEIDSSFVVRKIFPEFILRSCGSAVPISTFVSNVSEFFLAFDVYSVCFTYRDADAINDRTTRTNDTLSIAI